MITRPPSAAKSNSLCFISAVSGTGDISTLFLYSESVCPRNISVETTQLSGKPSFMAAHMYKSPKYIRRKASSSAAVLYSRMG